MNKTIELYDPEKKGESFIDVFYREFEEIYKEHTIKRICMCTNLFAQLIVYSSFEDGLEMVYEMVIEDEEKLRLMNKEYIWAYFNGIEIRVSYQYPSGMFIIEYE